MTITPRTQNRAGSGQPTGGQFLPMSRADDPDVAVESVGGPPTNPNTERYKNLRRGKNNSRSARVRKHRVTFHLDQQGWWQGTTEAGHIIHEIQALDPDYWESFRDDHPGITTWGGGIVGEMLNDGEVSPAGAIGKHPEGVQVALTATHTQRNRNVGRHTLTAAMARVRSAQRLLSYGVQGVKHGGQGLGPSGRAQSERNYRDVREAFREIRTPMGPSDYDKNGDHGGYYFGENGDLPISVLKAQVGDSTAFDKCVEGLGSSHSYDGGSAIISRYAVIHDDDLAERMTTLGRDSAEGGVGGVHLKHYDRATTVRGWVNAVVDDIESPPREPIPDEANRRLMDVTVRMLNKADPNLAPPDYVLNRVHKAAHRIGTTDTPAYQEFAGRHPSP